DRPVVQAGHRAVVRHGDRPARGDDVVGDRRRLLGGCQHADLVAGGDEVLGEVPDVELHAARDVEGVPADDPDPHQATLPAGLTRAGSRSATKTGWSMCQSSGYSRMKSEMRCTHAWVIAAMASSRGASGRSIGSPKVMTMPHRLPAACRRGPRSRS